MSDFLERIKPGPARLPPGRYAMWFPSTVDPLFTYSKTRRNIDQVYKISEGITTYAFANLLLRLKIPEHQSTRVAPPEELMTFPVLGPDEQVFVLSACKEKGLRFHFNESSTPAYINSILAAFVGYLEYLKRELVKIGVPLDEPGDLSPTDWWKDMERTVEEIEQRLEPIQAVGILNLMST